jgi:ATP-dependent Lon protease
MRDFRDAKAMAQTLREALSAKTLAVSHSQSLELVSKMLGAADWNTLSALIQAEPRRPPAPVARYPALPIRDTVLFPTMAGFPLFVGREKTKAALDHAFTQLREVVLAVQKDATHDEPGEHDVYDVGVLARLLEVTRLPDGSMKILVQAHRRVVIRRFLGEAGAWRAEVEDIREGPIPEAPELVRLALERYAAYAEARNIAQPTAVGLAQIGDPGRLADMIASFLAVTVAERQALLATVDPVARLEKVADLLAAA